MKILIVEDNPGDALLIQENLLEGFASTHIDISSVDRLSQAVKKLNDTAFDVVLLDLGLPDSIGLETFFKLNKEKPGFPIIILTGLNDEETSLTAVRCGAQDYLVKGNMNSYILHKSIIYAYERKKTEKALQDSQELYHEFIDSSMDLVFVKDSEFRNMVVNKKYMEFWGKTEAEIIGKTDFDFMPQDVAESCRKSDMKALEEHGILITLESFADRLYETRKFPVPLKDGKIGVGGFIRDITERKLAEEALKGSEEKWFSLVNNSPDFIALHDSEGRFLYLNHYAKGFCEKDVIGTYAYNYVSPDYQELFRKKTEECIKTWTNLKFEYQAFGEDKILKNYDTYFVPIKNKKDEINILVIARDTTDSKRLEQEQQESKDFLEKIINSITSPIFVKDDKHKFCLVNEALCSILNLPMEKLIGTTGYEFFPEEQMNVFIAKDQAVFNTGLENINEEYFTDGSGKIRTIVTKKTLYTDHYSNKYLVGIIDDISERKQAEEALIASEVSYRRLFESAKDGILILDADTGKIVDVNPFLIKLLGYSQKQFLNKFVWEIGFLKDIIANKEKFVELQNNEFIRYEDLPLKTSDGRLINVEFVSNVYLVNNHKVIQCNIRDITKRKKDEEELIKVRKAVETSGEVIFITETDGMFSFINPEFNKLYGWTHEEVVGKVTPRILKSEKTNPETYDTLWRTLLRKDVFKCEFINQTKDGRLINIESSANPIFDEIGNISGFLAIQRDITERKKAEIELFKAKERAEEMNRLKSSFLANMSHELRTPMNGIIGFSQLLQFEDEMPSIKEISNIIYKSSKRLMSTLNSILDLSRIGSGEMKPNYTLADVVELAHEAVNVFKAEAESKKLSLKVESNEENILANTDQRIVVEILINLINNALKFTDKGGVTVKVHHEKSGKNHYIVYDVIDTGIGIDEKDFDTIFEEFRQVSEGLSRGFEGTGLGLTICKHYTELLEGTITLKSKLDEGSTFTVKLPVTIEPEEYKKGMEDLLNESPLAIPHKGEKPLILYVEDDEVAVFYVKKLLKGAYNVDIAVNSATSVEMAKKKQYALILMDINLGKGENGIDATRKIRKLKNYKDVPIIALTAFAMVGDREIFIAEGCVDYLSKPFEGKELLDLLKKYL